MGFIYQKKPLAMSGATGVNFLWKDDHRPIYVMDNHRCALWCWLQEVSTVETYSLIHLDFHWDAAAGNADCLEVLTSFDDYLARTTGDVRFEAVMYDNYIQPMPVLRPNARDLFMLVHENEKHGQWDGDGFSGDVCMHKCLDGLYYLNKFQPSGKVIVNLDLDYFFVGSRAIFTEDWVTSVVGGLWQRHPDAIWTVAWSPEFCGGWEAVGSLSDLIFSAIGVPFRADMVLK